MSSFGEELLDCLARNAAEPWCLNRLEEVGGSTSSRRWRSVSHVDGSLTVCAEVSCNVVQSDSSDGLIDGAIWGIGEM